MKDFDKKVHMACPNCGGEVIAVDPANKTIALVWLNGTRDEESVETDLQPDPDDKNEIRCNSIYCSWTAPLRQAFKTGFASYSSYVIERSGAVQIYQDGNFGEIRAWLPFEALEELYLASKQKVGSNEG